MIRLNISERDTEKAEQPTSDSGPYDAEHNVHHPI
jgi:hypothetical protein